MEPYRKELYRKEQRSPAKHSFVPPSTDLVSKPSCQGRLGG